MKYMYTFLYLFRCNCTLFYSRNYSGVLGASPDGLVLLPITCEVNFQTPEAKDSSPDFVEVKCPYSAAQLTINEAVRSLKDFYLVV